MPKDLSSISYGWNWRCLATNYNETHSSLISALCSCQSSFAFTLKHVNVILWDLTARFVSLTGASVPVSPVWKVAIVADANRVIIISPLVAARVSTSMRIVMIVMMFVAIFFFCNLFIYLFIFGRAFWKEYCIA